MFLSKFKENRIKKKTQREVKKSLNGKPIFTKKKINSILVFTDSNTPNNIDKIIAELLKIKKTKITILKYIDQVPEETITDKYLSRSDFNIFGNIKRPFIKNLVTLKLDLLLNLTKENLFFEVFTSMSKASFKVGFYSTNLQLYDFMIDTETKDIESFMIELKKYLKILNKL